MTGPEYFLIGFFQIILIIAIWGSMHISSCKLNDIRELIRQGFLALNEQVPERWALLLEKHFSSRKDEEGVMFAQAVSKHLLKTKKRKRRTKAEMALEAIPESDTGEV